MAIPIAVAGAEQSLGVFVPVAEFSYSGAPFNVNLKDNGSWDPDAGSIVAWQWTLLYKPPGSTASILNPTTSTPTLQNVDKEGTYRVFLEVTDDNIPPEDSEPDQYLAPDSAFCKVVHKTQLHDWRIPATSERDWADVVYAIWMDIDDLLPSISQWDVTHQLFFTSGNQAQIQDNRVATGKGGESGLWLNSTTGVDTAAGAYYGLRVSPGRQMGAGDPVRGYYATDMDYGSEAIDPWQGIGFVAKWQTDPATLTATNVALRFQQSHPDHVGGVMLDFQHDAAGALDTQMVVKWAKAMVQDWGSADPVWTLGVVLPFFLGSDRMFLKELTFDHRTTMSSYVWQGSPGDEGGTIKWFIDAETTTTVSAQDIVLARVVRQKPVADESGEDFGIMWRESVAELDAAPPDPDIFPSRTLLMRRPDTEEWSFMGVQRARVAAPSTPVPFERPGWIQGQISDVNPPIDDATEWTFTVDLPSTVSVDLSEGGGWSNARGERPIMTWSSSRTSSSRRISPRPRTRSKSRSSTRSPTRRRVARGRSPRQRHRMGSPTSRRSHYRPP
jgi:hypothetical protein